MDIYGSLEESTGLTFFWVFLFVWFRVSFPGEGTRHGACPFFEAINPLRIRQFSRFVGVECNLTILRSFLVDLWRANF